MPSQLKIAKYSAATEPKLIVRPHCVINIRNSLLWKPANIKYRLH